MLLLSVKKKKDFLFFTLLLFFFQYLRGVSVFGHRVFRIYAVCILPFYIPAYLFINLETCLVWNEDFNLSHV